MTGYSAQASGQCPVRWLNRHALVTLPARVDQSNAEPVRQQLQGLVNRDLLVLIVDMSGTTDCDHACGEALAKVYQRAMITGTDLRLIVSAGSVHHVLQMVGLDRVTPVYSSVATAVAATRPADMPPPLGSAPPAPFSRQAGPAGGDVGVEIALLDSDGVIIWVNHAWQAFAAANGGDPARTGAGVSYLDACAAVPHDPVAAQVGAAIRRALAGDLPGSLTIEVPCHSPGTARWFDMLISPRRDDDGRSVGATVTLSLARAETRALVNAGGAGIRQYRPGNDEADEARCALLGELPDRLSGISRALQSTASQAAAPVAGQLQQAVSELASVIGELRVAGPDPRNRG
jgi:anti-anti-sigma regulatory factor